MKKNNKMDLEKTICESCSIRPDTLDGIGSCLISDCHNYQLAYNILSKKITGQKNEKSK